jgi:hypothetical protein
MASAAKTYVVEDADESAKSGIPPGEFPGTLAGLVDALDAAGYRSAAAGTPIALVIVEGEQRTIIRRCSRAARRRGQRPQRRSAAAMRADPQISAPSYWRTQPPSRRAWACRSAGTCGGP